MKTGILMALLAAMPLVAADNGSMNDAERAYLLEQLAQSKKVMLASIDGLTQAQWAYKPAPNVWSVQECAEHIILAETFLMETAQQILKTPVAPRLPTATSEGDRKLTAGIQDRSRKATAPEPIVPSGKFATPADAAREFIARRAKTVEYVKTTTDDLRAHAAPGPAGPMDAYQFLILLSAHTERHTAQIREVESGAGYPKSN